MKKKVFLLCVFSLVALLVQGKSDAKILRGLVFAPQMYYDGMEAAVFENGSFVTYHTDDGYNSFVKDVEYLSDNFSNLVYYLNPADADLQGYSFNLTAKIQTYSSRSTPEVDYGSLLEVDNDNITVENGKICLPVKLTQENKEKIKFNPKHQFFIFALKAHCETLSENENNNDMCSDWAVIYFSTHEEKPLDISFKGMSWWDEEGDYSIDLPTHVFQVTEDKIDNIKDSIVISGNEGHPVNIHKVSTNAAGITKCCLSVEDSSKKIYGYTYINVKILPNTTAICAPIGNNRENQNGNVYNILGQKLNVVKKGLYIKNGKVYLKR